LSWKRLAEHLSALADAVLEIVLHHVWQGSRRRHCGPRRGSPWLRMESSVQRARLRIDLDLIFLFDDEHATRPRLRAVRAPTVNWFDRAYFERTLFEIDLRLTPNGNAGLLVSTRRLGEVQRERQCLIVRFCLYTLVNLAIEQGCITYDCRSDVAAVPMMRRWVVGRTVNGRYKYSRNDNRAVDDARSVSPL